MGIRSYVRDRKQVNASRAGNGDRAARMAVHEEAARLQQGTAFQTDGGLDKKSAYAHAAKNYDANKLGDRTWGSGDRTYTTPKGE